MNFLQKIWNGLFDLFNTKKRDDEIYNDLVRKYTNASPDVANEIQETVYITVFVLTNDKTQVIEKTYPVVTEEKNLFNFLDIEYPDYWYKTSEEAEENLAKLIMNKRVSRPFSLAHGKKRGFKKIRRVCNLSISTRKKL